MITVVVSIIVLFFVLLGVKELLPARFKKFVCALCGAVVLTWLGLLFASYSDTVVIALLMGGSVVGITYVVSEKFPLFRLPVFLTLLFVAYSVIKLSFDARSVVLIVLLWVLFTAVFLYKNNKLIEKIVACCRNW
ncbi:hypothetical protein HY485_03265 [Candidatus Woesearchaeota archaeon]|nr:hypothetical protein [Candidatus Woesearchaeota archaeon]